MTITSETVDTRRDAPATPSQTRHVGTHRDASCVSPADHLFAEGIALLDAGDHLAAAEKVWHAAVTAMVTYSDARGWQPQDWHPHRKLMDIVKLRSEELGVPYLGTPDVPAPVGDAFSAANMLDEHVAHEGHFLDQESTRQTIEDARPLLDYFRLD